MEVGSLLHRRDHFRKRHRAAIDGQSRGAINERADSDARVNLIARGGSGSLNGRSSGKRGGNGSATLKESAPAQAGPRSFGRIAHVVLLSDDDFTLLEE